MFRLPTASSCPWRPRSALSSGCDTLGGWRSRPRRCHVLGVHTRPWEVATLSEAALTGNHPISQKQKARPLPLRKSSSLAATWTDGRLLPQKPVTVASRIKILFGGGRINWTSSLAPAAQDSGVGQRVVTPPGQRSSSVADVLIGGHPLPQQEMLVASSGKCLFHSDYPPWTIIAMALASGGKSLFVDVNPSALFCNDLHWPFFVSYVGWLRRLWQSIFGRRWMAGTGIGFIHHDMRYRAFCQK